MFVNKAPEVGIGNIAKDFSLPSPARLLFSREQKYYSLLEKSLAEKIQDLISFYHDILLHILIQINDLYLNLDVEIIEFRIF